MPGASHGTPKQGVGRLVSIKTFAVRIPLKLAPQFGGDGTDLTNRVNRTGHVDVTDGAASIFFISSGDMAAETLAGRKKLPIESSIEVMSVDQ